MKTITIIRHAQSKFNAGEYKTEEEIRNCWLTNYGVEQAKQLNHSFDLLVLSPLKRAFETYVNSNIKCKQLTISELVREQLDGRPLNFLDLEEVKSESSDEVRKRAREAVEYIKQLESNNIGIISHGCFIWYLLEQFGQPPIGTSNCQSITFNLH